jgi:hypothetical protein
MKNGSLIALGLLLGATALPVQALDAVGQRYVDQLVQGGPVSIRQAAQSMYHSGVRDTEVLDVAAEVLLQNYRSASSNNDTDAYAWVCKALGTSGNGRYKPVIAEVVANSNNRKLDRHCAKAEKDLPAGGAAYRAGSVNLAAYRAGNGRPAASQPAAAQPVQAARSGSASFSSIRTGMSMDEVNALIGPPSATYTHQTGKAWVPFNFQGKDVARVVALYKGKGRIVYSQNSVYAGVWRVLEVTDNPNETGYP